MKAHLGTFVNDATYRANTAAAYEACMAAANAHVDISTPSRLNEDLRTELSDTMVAKLGGFLKTFEERMEAKYAPKRDIVAPPHEDDAEKWFVLD